MTDPHFPPTLGARRARLVLRLRQVSLLVIQVCQLGLSLLGAWKLWELVWWR